MCRVATISPLFCVTLPEVRPNRRGHSKEKFSCFFISRPRSCSYLVSEGCWQPPLLLPTSIPLSVTHSHARAFELVHRLPCLSPFSPSVQSPHEVAPSRWMSSAFSSCSTIVLCRSASIGVSCWGRVGSMWCKIMMPTDHPRYVWVVQGGRTCVPVASDSVW